MENNENPANLPHAESNNNKTTLEPGGPLSVSCEVQTLTLRELQDRRCAVAIICSR